MILLLVCRCVASHIHPLLLSCISPLLSLQFIYHNLIIMFVLLDLLPVPGVLNIGENWGVEYRYNAL